LTGTFSSLGEGELNLVIGLNWGIVFFNITGSFILGHLFKDTDTVLAWAISYGAGSLALMLLISVLYSGASFFIFNTYIIHYNHCV